MIENNVQTETKRPHTHIETHIETFAPSIYYLELRALTCHKTL